VVFVFLTSLGCSSNEIKNPPPEVLGHWETADSKFEGFSFELSNEAITFTDLNAQENEVEYYLIQKWTKDLDQNQKVYYTVYYKNKEGLELPFAFFYDPSGGGIIRLKNQKTIVWTRLP